MSLFSKRQNNGFVKYRHKNKNRKQQINIGDSILVNENRLRGCELFVVDNTLFHIERVVLAQDKFMNMYLIFEDQICYIKPFTISFDNKKAKQFSKYDCLNQKLINDTIKKIEEKIEFTVKRMEKIRSVRFILEEFSGDEIKQMRRMLECHGNYVTCIENKNELVILIDNDNSNPFGLRGGGMTL